jgi:hypothetical protein
MTTTSALSHADSRRAIAAHFAGRASPRREAAMRDHTLGCAACHGYYQRHLILARLDPTAPEAKSRIARGLGLTADRRPARRPAAVAAALLLVPAAAALLLVARPEGTRLARDAAGPNAFVPRGGPTVTGQAPALWIYRIGRDAAGGGDRRPHIANGTMSARDELAFAYANPSGRRFVLIFAVDPHRHVHWFHPAWPPGAEHPNAVPAKPGPGPHELPEAIRHDFDHQDLIVHALFADRALEVETVEQAVRAAATWDAPPAGLDPDGIGVEMIRQALRIQP